MFFINKLPLEDRMEKALSVKPDKYNALFFIVSILLFAFAFVYIRISHTDAFAEKHYIYLFIPFFLIRCFALSFGNLLFFSLLLFLSAKFFSGKASFNEVLYALSFSMLPVIVILLISIPEFNLMKNDIWFLIPSIKISKAILILHFLLYPVKITLIILTIYISFVSFKIVEKLSVLKALISYLITIIFPLLIALFIYTYFHLLYIRSL